MTTESPKETHAFQAEVQQLLHLMINAVYSNKEIFLRELISNAADACDKLRFEALSDDALFEGESDLRVRVDFDATARTISVTDNGIGMSRDEVIENIGTIARSGTRQFVESLSGDQAKDSQLIGQFGVGFYSSFIIADRITLTTRRAGMGREHGVRWESDGSGSYTLETIERSDRGTTVTLHLKEGEDELLDDYRLRSIITRYSDHIPLPVEMPERDEEGNPKTEEDGTPVYTVVNRASALWARPKTEISDEEYKEFYKHVAHDFEDPLAWIHNHVEGRTEYTSLLYIPARAPFDLWDRDQRHGVKLYVQRVFIMDDAEQLMPRYLRFVRGVVDSNDLPLNISREILQNNRVIDSIRAASVKKVLGLLKDVADKDAERYQRFWNEFGRVLKEGPVEDRSNQEAILELLRFHSTHDDHADEPSVSLAQYRERMLEGQENIYILTADNLAAARNSPHLEIFRKKGIEVLLMPDRVDEWAMAHVTEYQGIAFKSVAKGDIELSGIGTETPEESVESAEEQELEPIIERVKSALGEEVSEVRLSHRLVDSPSCIVLGEHDMALYMQRLLRESGHDFPTQKPALELNPEHRLVRKLKDETDTDRFTDLAHILFDQAVLAEGGQLRDPAAFVRRLNGVLA